MSPNAGGLGGGGEWGVAGSQPRSTAVHITWHGAQINFGDLPPYLTYDSALSQARTKAVRANVLVLLKSVLVQCFLSKFQNWKYNKNCRPKVNFVLNHKSVCLPTVIICIGEVFRNECFTNFFGFMYKVYFCQKFYLKRSFLQSPRFFPYPIARFFEQRASELFECWCSCKVKKHQTSTARFDPLRVHEYLIFVAYGLRGQSQ
jgi:hypothetical protein